MLVTYRVFGFAWYVDMSDAVDTKNNMHFSKIAETHLELCQTSKVKRFVKIVNDF